MDISHLTVDFEPWRKILPQAAGANLPSEDIVGITNMTVAECAILNEGGNRDWLVDPSIWNSRLLVTFVYGDKIRKYGGLHRGTHPLGVGHRAANHEQPYKDRLETILSGFVGVNHDQLEDGSQKPEIRKALLNLILDGWVGNPGLRPMLAKDILSLTDGPGLSSRARYKAQIEKAKALTTNPRAKLVRFLDKLDNTSLDETMVRDGVIADRATIIERAVLARKKVPIVLALPDDVIAPLQKDEYVTKVRSLEFFAKKAKAELVILYPETTPERIWRSAAFMSRRVSRAIPFLSF